MRPASIGALGGCRCAGSATNAKPAEMASHALPLKSCPGFVITSSSAQIVSLMPSKKPLPGHSCPPKVSGGRLPSARRTDVDDVRTAICPWLTRSVVARVAGSLRHLDLGGLPILASDKTPDAALCVARDVVMHMLEQRPELAGRLAEKKIRLAIMGATELTTDIPDHSDLTPKDYWDKRARGLGATLDRPAVSGAEENVLCYPTDVYRGESILVHELSHAILNIAVELFEPTMKTRVQAAYDAAIKAGLFANTYAATNADEYWAEGAQDWFDTNLTADPPNGVHNTIHTRAQLKAYDPGLAALLAEVFGDRPWRYACPPDQTP